MNEAELPIKTKIAVWWLIVAGALLTICNAAFMFLVAVYYFAQSIDAYSGPSSSLYALWFLIPMASSIFAICSGISLSRKSKRAWIAAIIALCTAMICSIGIYSFLLIKTYDKHVISAIVLLIGSLIYLSPLVLIILDRKNYFEMIKGQSETLYKAMLPAKTNIAVWCLFITALTIVSSFVMLFFGGLFIAFLNVILGGLLLAKRGWSWISAIIVFYAEIISIIILLVLYPDGRYYILAFLIASLIPFILTVLDRKNYSEMVSRRELEMKASAAP